MQCLLTQHDECQLSTTPETRRPVLFLSVHDVTNVPHEAESQNRSVSVPVRLPYTTRTIPRIYWADVNTPHPPTQTQSTLTSAVSS
jgi:hypothetical protein